MNLKNALRIEGLGKCLFCGFKFLYKYVIIQLCIFSLFFWAFPINAEAQKNSEPPYLVVLSMDGFRWDYIDSIATPNLHRFIKNGVRAKSLIPSFPSVTFPNHYTMATGLYPDHHGIVHNNFYDSTLNALYKLGDKKTVEDGRFYGGEPIWITAEKQNVKSASFYWVGSEADIQGKHPSYWKPYDKKVTYEQRIDTVVSWLSLPEKSRPHLVMFYYDQPDKAGHETGPFSHETKSMVMRMDTLAGKLLEKMKALSVYSQINIIITSDHGMGYVNASRKIFLDDYLKKEWCKRITGHNPVYMVDAAPGFSDSIVMKLSTAQHLKFWKKQDVPEKLHYGSNSRVGQLVIAAGSAYSIGWRGEKTDNAGAHGYDPSDTDMHGVFFASGPAFKKGYQCESFENIHLYSIFSAVLRLKPAKNDGSIDKVLDIFQTKK